MNNVGDILTFSLAGAPQTGYSYVWKWWDSTVDATRIPTVQKKLNIGGTLVMNATQSDQFGQSHIYNGTVVVNSPPVVIPAPTISNNDVSFPFRSILQSTAYDPDHPGGTELSFAWYNGPTLISSGTTTVPSTGTYTNKLEVDNINSNQTLTQIITDTGTGVTRVNYSLRGFQPSGLQGSGSSISNSIVNSANNLSQIIIGPGQEATFTAYAQDTSPGQLSFHWLAGTLDGWAATFQTTNVPVPQSNGLYKSQITLSVESELPGLKTVECTVTNLQTQQSINFNNTVNLIAASPPNITSISADAPIINGGYAVSQAGFVHFSVTAADPNNALMSYEWVFTQPQITLFGRTVLIRPADYAVFDESQLVGNGTNPGTGPVPILGQVTVSDRFGQSSTVSLNQFIATLVWPFTQVSPQTSGTGSTTLQKRYWGVFDSPTVTTNDLTTFDSDFSSERNQSNLFTPSGQFIYILYPASFGQATITVNGTIATDWLLTVQTFNGIPYNVYRSSTQLTNTSQIVIS
jgi:hypothetical protein